MGEKNDPQKRGYSVVPVELEALWPKIEADLARIEGHRKRAEVEHSRQQRRREVELLYRELDHTEFDCFPSLPQFRKLPTLQKFYDSTLDVKSVKWRNEFVDTLVKNEVQEWAKRTIEAFLERLGYPEWPQTKTLAHPVHRASSRFTCIRCSKSGPKAKRNKALTFREAAHHMCLIPEEGNKDQWSPKNFILDVKVCPSGSYLIRRTRVERMGRLLPLLPGLRLPSA